MLARLNLVAYRSAAVTPDVAEALRQVELRAATYKGARLNFRGTPKHEATWGALPTPPALSLVPAGREVHLRLSLPKADPVAEIALLWGLVIPAGFTPKNRYPIPGTDDDVFHYFGPWQGVLDYLGGEGRGDLAWPSVCCAAQADVGAWGGDRPTERFVQAQLHRLGLHCGPVDGLITDTVTTALQALGVTGKTLDEMADVLAKYKTPVLSPRERRVGHIIVPGDDLSVLSYGQVATTRTPQGVALTIDGPGRVVLNIGYGET